MPTDIISPCRNAGMVPLCETCRHADESQTEGPAVGWRANSKRRPWCEGYLKKGDAK